MFANYRLPDQTNVTFGPQQLLARFLLHGDRAARERGVYLSLEHDFDALIEFNKTQATAWFPLIPVFDPKCSDLTPENSFWIAGRNHVGDIVTTQCARLFDWQDTNFNREFESLRIAYRDPDLDRWPEECAFSNVALGERISGRVCYSGGAWYHPDYRGRGLAAIIPRLSRTIAYSHWNTDFTISLAESVLVEKGVVARYGYTRVEPGIDWLNSFLGHLLNLHLLWMDRGELLNDLVVQLTEPAEYQHRALAQM
jgi:hypothetical protein